MKRKKIVTYVILSSFVLCAIILAGCTDTNSNNTISSVLNNMTKITTTLDKVQDIDANELILDDFMNDNELNLIDANLNSKLVKNNAMNNYFIKISNLNDNVISTIDVNDKICSYKCYIFDKVSDIESKCNYINENKIKLSENQSKSINELNNVISANTTRISLTRNEITNNLKNVSKLKNEYTSKTEQLNSRYTKLKSSLNTRLSYYNNLLTSLNSLSTVLCDNTDLDNKYICDDYIFDDQEKEFLERHLSKASGFTKNIDTYENAGTNIYGDYRNNPMYNPENYLKNYNPGYGMYGNGYAVNGYGIMNNGINGMYPFGYGMNGFNGGYGYGMPYGNGIMYPNINTFGTYKNIDTYRSKKDLNKIEENENIENEQNSITKDSTVENKPTSTTPLQPKPRPRPMPYNNHKTKDIKNKDIVNVNEFEEDDDNEDHFVDSQDKPKIEKINEE